MRAADGGARLLLSVRVESEGDTRDEMLSVFTARLAKMPTVGVLNGEEYAHFARESEIARAIDLGLRLLGFGGASRVHLMEKMRQRGVKRDIAVAAVEEICARGYLSETRGVENEVKKGLQKLWGDRRILADMRAKGYGAEALSVAEELLKSENAPERCAKLIKRRRMVLPSEEREIARFVAALVRYGYTVSEIKEALREAGQPD